jgi:twinkle protein
MPCIEKLPHSCGSSDGLQVFEADGKYSGFCFVCNTYVDNPYEDRPEGYKPTVKIKTEEDIKKELEEIGSLKAITLNDRRLNATTLDHFGVKVGLSEEDGSTPAIHYYPYYKGKELVGYKAYIPETRKMFAIPTIRGADFFGWQQAIASGSPRLYITEGERDALTVWQVLVKKQRGTQYEGNIPAVVSLTSGASSAKQSLSEAASKLKEHFKEVVLVFDTDEAGLKATEEGLKAYPGAKAVKVPGKDPNDCLMSGREKALVNALLFQAAAPKNTRIINLSSLVEKTLEPVEWGLSFPWQKLTQMTRGLRFGETYYFGAGVKMGKSELLNALAAHFAVEHKLKVFLAKPEESVIKTTRLLLAKVEGRIFHDPQVEYDPADVKRAAQILDDRIFLLDKYQHVGWKSLKEDIYDAAQNKGCKLVFVDPITNLTNGIPAAEANTVLQEIAQDMAAMSLDLGICIFIFCHLKAPEAGPPHERGGKVYSNQFAGSRAMMRSCNYMLGLEGNKDEELSMEERNLRRLVLLEDREFGEVGTVPLYWDIKTHKFNEVKS